MVNLKIGFIVLLVAVLDIHYLQAFKQNKQFGTLIKSIKNKTLKVENLSPIEDISHDSEYSDEDEIQYCTCGVFLSGQFKNKNKSSPKGLPIMTKELDVVFQCTPFGIKQCQTKCVEAIIKHLPKSNDILCATVDKDIHKEKAYLFVQNCSKNWHNTKLSAGKEFCCKDNVSYKCPLL